VGHAAETSRSGIHPAILSEGLARRPEPSEVGRWGGTIRVRSPTGQGARLQIDLPIQDRPSS